MMVARRPIREVGVPTVLRSGPYRFSFFSDEHEPPHIHVASADGKATFGLNPVRLQRATGYTAPEIRRIRQLVITHQGEFLRRWHEFFST